MSSSPYLSPSSPKREPEKNMADRGDSRDSRYARGSYGDTQRPESRSGRISPRYSSREYEEDRSDGYYNSRERGDGYSRNEPQRRKNVIEDVEDMSYTIGKVSDLLKSTSLKVTNLEERFVGKSGDEMVPEELTVLISTLSSVEEKQKGIVQRLEALESSVSSLDSLRTKIENCQLRIKGLEPNDTGDG